MTAGLTTAGMTAQDAGALLGGSRKPSRESLGDDPAGFGAALAQSADDAHPESGAAAADPAPQSDSLLKTTFDATTAADAGSPASSGATSSRAATQDWTAAPGDRLASRMTAAWLNAASQPGSAAAPSDGQQQGAPLSLASLGIGAAAVTAEGAKTAASNALASAVQKKGASAPLGGDSSSIASNAADAGLGAAPDASLQVAAPQLPTARTGVRWPWAVVSSDQPASPTRQTAKSDATSDGVASTTSDATAQGAVALQQTLVQATATAALVAQTVAPLPSTLSATAAEISPPPSTPSSPSTLADSLARIGAALSGPATPQTLSNARAAATRDAATVSVHVVSQQTWLPPVDPAFSGGSQSDGSPARQGAAAPAARGAQSDQGGATGDFSAAAQQPANSAAPQPASLLTPPGFSVASSTTAAGAATPAPATAAAAPGVPDAASAPAASLRRDLEITLTPTDLGGLQVKLKSTGDRLELAFVSDRGETARLISDKSAALANQLNHAGLGLGGVDISSSAAGGMPGGADSSGGQGGQQQASSQTSTGSSQGNGGQNSADPETARQRQNLSGRARQDNTNDTGDISRNSRGVAGDRDLYL